MPLIRNAFVALTLACIARAQAPQAAPEPDSPNEDELTSAFVAERFAHGTAGAEWVGALSATVVEPPKLLDAHGADDSIVGQLAQRFDLAGPQALREWVARNRPIIDRLAALPEPAGPLPLQEPVSIEQLTAPPGTHVIGEKVRLLLAAVAVAPEPQRKQELVRTIDHIVGLCVQGHTLLELTSASAWESWKWELLLSGLQREREAYFPAVQSAAAIPLVEPLAEAIDAEQRPQMRIAAQRKEFGDRNIFGTPPLFAEELEQLDAFYATELPTLIREAPRIEDLRRRLDERVAGVPSKSLKKVIDEWLETCDVVRIVEFAYYASDLQRFTQRAAAMGPVEAARVSTRFLHVFELTDAPLNVEVIAGHDGRGFFLWPAKKLLAEGGLHLLSGNESGESDESGVPVAHGRDINRTEGHSSSFAHLGMLVIERPPSPKACPTVAAGGAQRRRWSRPKNETPQRGPGRDRLRNVTGEALSFRLSARGHCLEAVAQATAATKGHGGRPLHPAATRDVPTFPMGKAGAMPLLAGLAGSKP